MAKRSLYTIPDPEKVALKEIARRHKLSQAEVIRRLIRLGAQKDGIAIPPSRLQLQPDGSPPSGSEPAGKEWPNA